MQMYDVRIQADFRDRTVQGAVFTVPGENEEKAAGLAQLRALEKWPGAALRVFGVRPSGDKFEQDPSTNPNAFDDAAARAAKEAGARPDPHAALTPPQKQKLLDDQELQPNRLPNPRSYSEWKGMQWFRLRRFAAHASGLGGPAIKASDIVDSDGRSARDNALLILRERGLIMLDAPQKPKAA